MSGQVPAPRRPENARSLCHVCKLQHHPLAMLLSCLRSGYAADRFVAEARRAVAATAGAASTSVEP